MGDDSEHIMDQFEKYLDTTLGSTADDSSVAGNSSGNSGDRIAENGTTTPFMAVLWLHSMHKPHPAMPQYYHNYTDAFGEPAGDYLGTLTQMDVQIGRLRKMLKDKGLAENTMLWVRLPGLQFLHRSQLYCCSSIDPSCTASVKVALLTHHFTPLLHSTPAITDLQWKVACGTTIRTQHLPRRMVSGSVRLLCTRAAFASLASLR
jgi:hypothetical protein